MQSDLKIKEEAERRSRVKESGGGAGRRTKSYTKVTMKTGVQVKMKVG